MEQVTRETVTTGRTPTPTGVVNSSVHSVVREENNSFTAQNLVYFLFGILEFLLLFRAIFKATGANPSSGFVSFIYGLTSLFVAPFAGIFRTATAEGNVARAVFEPATLVAMVVYALLAWGIVKLIAIATKEPEV